MMKCGKSVWARRPTVVLSLLLFDPRLRRSAKLGAHRHLRGARKSVRWEGTGTSAKKHERLVRVPPCRPSRFGGNLPQNTPSEGGSPMDIVPLGPGFGAELRGVTLSDVAADDAAYAAV